MIKHEPKHPTLSYPHLSPSILSSHLPHFPNLEVVSSNLAGRTILLRMVALLSDKKFERAHHFSIP